MKCEKCGYPRVTYVVSRKKRWKGAFGDAFRADRETEGRVDFKSNPCPKCGHINRV